MVWIGDRPEVVSHVNDDVYDHHIGCHKMTCGCFLASLSPVSPILGLGWPDSFWCFVHMYILLLLLQPKISTTRCLMLALCRSNVRQLQQQLQVPGPKLFKLLATYPAALDSAAASVVNHVTSLQELLSLSKSSTLKIVCSNTN